MKKLVLGCGLDKREGYINIDIRSNVKPDLIHDLAKPLPYESNSVDEILAKDVLEHLPWRAVKGVLRDWFRVLKAGGRMYLQTPDLHVLAHKIAGEEIREWQQINYWMYGAQDYPENTHKAGFTVYSLAGLLREVGFRVEKIQNDGGSNIMCWAVK